MQKRYSINKKMFSIFFVIALTLISGELLVRAYDFIKGVDGIITHNASQEPLFRDHSYLNFILKPNSHFKWNIKNPQDITINTLGYRSKEFSPIKPKGTFRIFTIGGSSTFDPYARDNEHTWPSRLEGLLQKHNPTKKNIEVINGGVPAYSSYEYTASVLFRIMNYEPDMIIFYETINDAIIAGHVTPYKDIHDVRGHIYGRSIFWRLLNHSVLFDVLYYQVYHGAMKHHTARWKVEDKNPEFIDFGVSAFERNLSNIIFTGKANNVKIILSTAPIWEEKINWTKRSRQIMSPVIRKCRSVIYKLASFYEVPLIDNASLIPMNETTLHNESHLTEKGADILTNNLSEEIIRLGLIK